MANQILQQIATSEMKKHDIIQRIIFIFEDNIFDYVSPK